ncbi:MAG TPA: decaprenyl-phosphate phosphoribosyltransferase [Bacteroidales bacterium]|nr:decaprenyl-phosphate phosphoribosyltransferase [Bacteroidales bacterium]
MISIIKLLRPTQWTKNCFIFLPLFFNGKIFNLSLFIACVVAFVAFSLASSAVYCFNDIFDVDADRLHPQKCQRPIAAGKVSVKTAYGVMALCFTLAMVVLYVFSETAKYTLMALVAFYFVMSIAYCLRLKRYAIVDVSVIAIGFVLRMVVGGQAANIWLSEWIVIMTYLLALLLAFAKRRDDVVLYQSTGMLPRESTHRYNLDFINQVMTVVSTITIITYIMYTLSPDVTARFHTKHLYLTAIFVLSGIIRYLQVTFVDLKSGNPTKILMNDRFIQVCMVGWVSAFLFIIYL